MDEVLEAGGEIAKRNVEQSIMQHGHYRTGTLLRSIRAIRSLKNVQQYNVCDLTNSKVSSNGVRNMQTMNIIGEKDIYRLVFKSRRPEAEAFQDWVYETIRELRKASGLEGYEAFKMLDKEHQKEAMKKLHDSIAASRGL